MSRIKDIVGVFLLLSALLAGSSAYSQDDCETTITQANQEFEAGHFLNIPAILDKCRKQFNADQRQRANLLLTQTYLILDDPIRARASYLEVLRANPEFVAEENILPAELVLLSKSFTATPIFAWFLKIGGNVTPVRTIHDLHAFGQENVREEYSLKPGYQVGGGGDFYLSKNIAFRGDITYSYQAYQHTTKNYFQRDTKTFDETMGWINGSLSVMYTKDLGKYRPYGYAGYGASYLLRDRARIQSVRVSASQDGPKEDKTSPDVDFLSKRNRFNSSIIIGGGVKGKFGLQFLFIDVRYAFGLRNVVKTSSLYGDNELDPLSPEYLDSSNPTVLYNHVDDLFRLDNLSISIGVIQPFYNPRELKRPRLKRAK